MLQKPVVDVFKPPLMLQTLSRQLKRRKSRKRKGEMRGMQWEDRVVEVQYVLSPGKN